MQTGWVPVTAVAMDKNTLNDKGHLFLSFKLNGSGT